MRHAHRPKAMAGILRLAALAGLAAMVFGLPHCGKQYALLLTITSTSLVETFDLRVKDIDTGKTVLERIGERVDPDNPNRDISRPGEALKVAIEFSQPGNYLVYVLGRAGQGDAGQQYALRDFRVDDVREESLKLVPLAQDKDEDGYPACDPSCRTTGGIACRFFDCDDDDPLVHPFATEVCDNGKDDDCSALCGAPADQGDEKCVDNDGDGVPAPTDCDDNDPCRSPKIKEDANFCQTPEAQFPTLPKACLDRLASEGKTATPPLCGDNIDQDCNGQDVACKVDKDCDGVSPPADCDDDNKEINPSAREICDGIDNNCDTVIDEGCVSCDVDGDGHASPKVTDPNCTDDKGNPLPKDDPDDFDAGRHPRTTADSGGAEGGSVLMALRQFCSYDQEKNGKRQRDLDHDGDGKTALADGCPSDECDKDGDGFAGPQCSPPKLVEDCDDSDPKRFPGAPDFCGDGIEQNCQADAACAQIVDKDKDGYAADVDCDDNDPERYPWALEICDGIDNDCDQLIDEFNPDATGKLIPTTDPLCNHNNEGECGGGGKATDQVCTPGTPGCSPTGRKLSGLCACSRTEDKGAKATRSSNRAMCANEDLAADASPRCFGGLLKLSERCDPKDWDCNGAPDDPTGQNPFVDKGKACGTNIGNCVAGTVIGCDLSKAPAEASLIEQVLAAQGIEYNRHWVCEPTQAGGNFWLPTAERCNGKDDDCNGTLPASEIDTDNDKYLPCSGCTKGSGRLDLLAAMLGCGDCNNGQPSIFPGAPEQCNNIDDNCQSGINDDGADQCSGGLSCCSGQKACRNLQTDVFNCGDCGKACNSNVANRCVGGNCACGSTGGPCGPGLNCVGSGSSATCQCISNGRCAGCCDGNVCRGGGSTGNCGVNGQACQNCVDGNECTKDQCNSGSCANPTEPSTKSCNGGSGRCFNSSCCENCIGGGQCRSGNTGQYCGSGGQACGTCTTANPCRSADCSTQTCVISNISGSCPSGTCRNGNCCGPGGNRCWTGSSCVNSSNTNCGDDGNSCIDCTATGRTCSGDTCVCNGCTSGPNCFSGSSDSNCGSGGGSCTDCTSNGRTCSGGNCVCGGCFTGGGNCVAGSSDSNCGSGGGSCTDCTSTGQTCSGGSCVCAGCFTGGGNCVAGTADNACGSGGGSCTNCNSSGRTCNAGSCGCAGCVDGSSICQGGNDTGACGSGGGSCQVCPSGNACQAPTCSSGSCGFTAANDGQPCNSGSGTCNNQVCVPNVDAGPGSDT